jgi:hypothetical protein
VLWRRSSSKMHKCRERRQRQLPRVRCLSHREYEPTGYSAAEPPARLLADLAALNCRAPTLHLCALRKNLSTSAQRHVSVGNATRSFSWYCTVLLPGENCACPCCVASTARATIIPADSRVLRLPACVIFSAGNVYVTQLRVLGGGPEADPTAAVKHRAQAGRLLDAGSSACRLI